MIFDQQISRKPNNYPWTEEFKKAIHKGFWTDAEFTFAPDIHDFKVNMSNKEKDIVTKSLSAIGQVEVRVKEFWANLGTNLRQPCFSDLGYVMANTEVIHGDAYERLLEVLGMDKIFEENLKLDIIQGRDAYLRKHNHKFYKDSKKQYIYSLILFTLFVENVSLFGQFYTINWLYKNKNILLHTNQQVKYTRQEEQLHALIGIKIINTARQEYSELFDEDLENIISGQVKKAIIAEDNISEWILGNYDEEGLNINILKQFIRHRMNESLRQVGFKKAFDIDERLIEKTVWFEETLTGNTSTDFFHTRPVEYSENSQSFDDIF